MRMILALLSLAMAGQAAGADAPIRVPSASGDPVLVDGRIEPGEWRDARTMMTGDSIAVLVKEYRGHVFMAIRCPFNRVAYTDVFLRLDNGEVWNLHASSQLGEQRLELSALRDTLPVSRWGYTNGWYANETRFDRRLAESLVRKDPGRDRQRMLLDTTYPYDGFEFQLKRDRFPGASWGLRVEVNAAFPGFPNVALPSSSTRAAPDTWATLSFDAKR